MPTLKGVGAVSDPFPADEAPTSLLVGHTRSRVLGSGARRGRGRRKSRPGRRAREGAISGAATRKALLLLERELDKALAESELAQGAPPPDGPPRLFNNRELIASMRVLGLDVQRERAGLSSVAGAGPDTDGPEANWGPVSFSCSDYPSSSVTAFVPHVHLGPAFCQLQIS